MPQTTIPRSAAAATSIEALRIPEVTTSRSAGNRSRMLRVTGVRSRITTRISASPTAPTSSSSSPRCSRRAVTARSGSTDQSAYDVATPW